MKTPTAARLHDADHARWYDPRTGLPVLEVPKADGKGMTNTTLAHARKLGLFPSVTNTLDVVPKPGLDAWKDEQLVLTVLTTPRLPNESDDDFVRRVLVKDEQHKQEAAMAADFGSSGHEKLHRYFATGEITSDPIYRPYVEMAAQWASLLSLTAVAVEQPLIGDGYAGTCDMIAKTSSDEIVVVDWKFTTSIPKKSPWETHTAQIAAYSQMIARQFGGDDTEYCKCQMFVCYLDREKPDVFAPMRVSAEDAAWGIATFSAAYALWCAIKRFDPREAQR